MGERQSAGTGRGRRRRRRSHGPRRRLNTARLAAAAATALGLGALGLFAWLVVVYPESRAPGSGRAVALSLSSGATAAQVGAQLAEQGLVQDGALWGLYARVLGAGERLRSGDILVHDAMSVRELLQRVAEGYGSVEVRITIPEGYTVFDVADRLQRWGICARDPFLRALQDRALLDRLQIPARAQSAEGYLFPDTYRLTDGLSPHDVVERLVSNARRRWSPLLDSRSGALERLEGELGWDFHDVLILASIVEREAAVASEQRVIAGVFLNRLTDPGFTPRRLQADPTVAYGCLVDETLQSCQGFNGRRVTRRMTNGVENTYNTYRHDGLPPGPIANPGLGAVESVLEAEQHDFLYFVASGGGQHEFSSTLEAHNAAVRRFRGH